MMIRNTFFLLSTAALLVACSNGKSEDAAATTAADTSADAAEAILGNAAETALQSETASFEIPALPDVVAKINDTIEITGPEVQKIIDQQLQRYRMMGAGGRQLAEITVQAREDILEKMVLQKILQAEAAAQNFAATDEDVDAFIKDHLPPGATLDAIAKQQGITADDIKKELKDNLGIEKLIEKQFEGFAEFTDEELKAEYDKIAKEMPKAFEVPESVEASHILVKVEEGADEATKAAAKQKIDDLRQKLVDGADFSKLAEENSDCPSAKRGGNLGEFGRGQMVKPFEDAAFTQAIDEIGPVIETQFGYHIVKVTKKTEAGTRTFEDVKDEIAKFMDNRRKNETADKFIQGIREKAKVETFLPKVELPEEEPAAEPEAPRELPGWAQ